jgi:hypothetical protein
MRHHFRHPQAMFNKGSLFYSHCGLGLPMALFGAGSHNLITMSLQEHLMAKKKADCTGCRSHNPQNQATRWAPQKILICANAAATTYDGAASENKNKANANK